MVIRYGPNLNRCKHPEILMDPEKSEMALGDDPCHNFCACWDVRISTCWINDDDDYLYSKGHYDPVELCYECNCELAPDEYGVCNDCRALEKQETNVERG